MRLWALAALAPLILGGCAETDRYVFHDAFAEARHRGENERLYEADLKTCGHAAGSEYCRLAADDGNLARLYPPQTQANPPRGVIVYDQSQCQGTFEGGRCLGQARVYTDPQPRCHDQVINGVCSGPVF